MPFWLFEWLLTHHFLKSEKSVNGRSFAFGVIREGMAMMEKFDDFKSA